MIWTSPGRRCGQPCVKGTRIDVSLIARSLDDWSINRICREFPGLTKDQVWAAIAYYWKNRERFVRNH